MAEIGKLTPITGLPWSARHVRAPGGESRRERPPRRPPEPPEHRDGDDAPHIDEYA